jgi:hypothetical protein
MSEFETEVIDKLNELIKIQRDTLDFFLKTEEEITGNPTENSKAYIDELKKDNFFPSGG